MKAFIAGGPGWVGSQVTGLLRARGAEVVLDGQDGGVDYARDVRVRELLQGVDTIINVLSAANHQGEVDAVHFYEQSTRTLTAEGERAGVRHHILLSVLGLGDGEVPGHYLGKIAQARAVRAGALPYTIVSSLRFHRPVPGPAHQHTAGGVSRAPQRGAQPLGFYELAALVAEVALVGTPLGEIEILDPVLHLTDDQCGRVLFHP